MSMELWLLMVLGMGNGLLHAFDADHVVAVSSLAGSGKKVSRRQIFRTALMWSLGHGTVLLFIVFLALGLGVVLPESLFSLAELAIGIILVLVGLGLLLRVYRHRLRITQHDHGDGHTHTHIHHPEHHHASDHKPVLVGMIHGLAGSAPLLAVLPALFQQNYGAAGFYILLFSAAVCLAMCLFGGLLGGVSHFICARVESGFSHLQKVLGVQAILFGGYWIYQAV